MEKIWMLAEGGMTCSIVLEMTPCGSLSLLELDAGAVSELELFKTGSILVPFS